MNRTTTIAYLRVSTDEQADSGAGLAAQQAAISSMAARMGGQIVAWHRDEGISGSASIEKRPGLMAAIEALGKGDILLVAKRDRLSRDMMLSCFLEKEAARRGARIVSAAGEGTETDDPTSMLMRRIVDAFAEYERQIIRARTKAALRAKRDKGERTGGIPFGFTLAADAHTLIADTKEQHTAELIVALRREGLSYRKIIAELDRQGVRPKCGAKWHAKVVRDICERQF